MEKDDQEQAAMELAETGGALGLEVPESMEISIDEIALPELAHLGTMELLLQACANHLYSLDRMQTAWMNAMLVAELPHFTASGGGESGGSSISDGLSSAASAAGLFHTLGKTETLSMLGGPEAMIAAAVVAFLGTMLLGGKSSEGNGEAEGFEDLQASLLEGLLEGKSFQELFSPEWRAGMEAERAERELQEALKFVPVQMLPLEYYEYGHEVGEELTEEEKQKQTEFIWKSPEERDQYISQAIYDYALAKGNLGIISAETFDPRWKMPELMEQGPYQIEDMGRLVEDGVEENSGNRGIVSTDAAVGVRQMEVTINCNFDGVEMTREEIKKLAEQLAECLEDAAGAAGNEDS
ncbi:hypothetical protein [Angelakisella massiliensis]|uniref:hypothetical protein n=1 Tax=Angelakisella massiliensis TaxID=1871018 RepID=UPI0024B0AD21|nr:hypothetical protein [Angelakisella massiliensis]